ncbi:MAG: SDR family NAD(P)-dependent oxidoreductase [Okeania sp. SIO2G4]|uniref:SDR family NAD(P)-dependent oxidoreductase n=1 Tax=unclassified Okeania TaxID=2634635 RepID=UPI0013B983D9|nr:MULTISPECIES: SDR family NAD(P)-dependent oxidoreductase [unclassified Okeania]NEP41907.1 SDR family NAD(P)-dependent oxidoreductase [Okeania sp. SIO2H7]NEP76085.1 SDR family NAD(P)-dependent oxidoreductase [Okeania sp. SIO2G5]NEP97263.1 SDR family NAD(P)-dependent oxidoreductase [Okeania sp. SIO2F5]NEQ94979.1 SDR family NAD(P)-dependent oxidoreductase [Okeania sp. SIO2G4]
MTDLKGKVALVTGATRGIGKGIAIGLGEAGATIYITGRSLERPCVNDGVSGTLQETQLAIEKAGGKCIPVQVDHGDDEQVRLLFERIENEQQGQLHILVNNVFSGVEAIRNAYGQPFWKSEPSLWDLVNNVGLRSHYISSVFAARMMAPRGGGIIFTISSWGGMSYLFGAAYGAGKAASDRLAADMAVELKADNIASISIWPGIVGTEHIINFTNQLSQSNTVDSFGDSENWETPLFIGRVIANLAAEPSIMSHTGKVRIVAELAEKYNILDENGNCPISVRSLRFLIPFTIPALRKYAWLIPNFKIPWFLLLWGRLISPQI